MLRRPRLRLAYAYDREERPGVHDAVGVERALRRERLRRAELLGNQSRRTRPMPWWCEIVPPAASVASIAAPQMRK